VRAQTLYDSWYISLYNFLFTGLPVITMGLFERDASLDAYEAHPQLYWNGQRDGLVCAVL
jgi:phospholipid-transporting ATPase